MNIGIVTVYNSHNSGSYWQARALMMYLKSLGANVVFVKRDVKGTSAQYKPHLLKMLKAGVKLNPQRVRRLSKSWKHFKKSQEAFSIINLDSVSDLDGVVVGSDTLWDITNNYFRENRDLYFGENLKNKSVVSYAVSCGNSKVSDFMKFPDVKDGLQKFLNISVRDDGTAKVVSAISGNAPVIVGDPTMLLELKDYRQLVEIPTGMGNYIFVYCFEDMSQEQSQLLKSFAKKNNLRIVSGVNELSFSDQTVSNSPMVFLQSMLGAKYVVTDTFHGMMFSLNLHKQFVVVNRNKRKVNDFLKSVEFEDRITFDSGNITDVLSFNVDYSNRLSRIEALKKRSREYLQTCINQMR